MSRRTPLPPPPPPAEIRTWPDREAMLADRAGVLQGLTGQLLGVPRLLLFLLQLAGLQLGWGLVGAGLAGFDRLDPLSAVLLGVCVALGLAVLVPLGLLAGFGVRRDLRIRRLLAQWSALDLDPARDSRLGAPGRSLAWLLVSFLLAAFGLWVSFAAPAAARPGSWTYGEVAYFMGVGVLCWVAGLTGVAKAVAHYRWAARLTSVVPAAVAPGEARG
ncbi:hypothetical protein QRN89_20960 [Streptomyces chengbuensis]|uniref:hypothetical protein n=1 Tax=Streptomyces TaxID=1883 RepID=UPI0025B4B0C5|nr:hypothetical protein [Streptomyces sp. HUAS CB01]WJY52047.1 hypothetical protein QRN89_20960 [Streptomyces sp. HUAS CB01]